MRKNYKNYYTRFEKLESFLDSFHKVDESTRFKKYASFKNFFTSLRNYLFGDHKWYSYMRARSVVRFYLEDPKAPEAQSLKVQAIYKKLGQYQGKQFTQPLKENFKKRFHTAPKEKTPIPPSPLPNTVPLSDSPGSKDKKSSAGYEAPVKPQIIVDNTLFVPPPPNKKIKQPKAKKIIADPKDMKAPLVKLDSDTLPPVSARLLFHLSADEFGKNSSYEGLGSLEPLTYILSYFQARKAMGGKLADNQDFIIEQLEKAKALAEVSCDQVLMKKHIQKAFTKNEPCLIPGGWIGSPSGHAMYYELVPNEDGKSANLRIFNTGDGSQHHERVKLGVKDKVYPLEWKNIPREKFLEEETLIALHALEALTEHPDRNGKKDHFSSNDIYHGLKKQLGVTPETTFSTGQETEKKAIKEQRSGICAYRSLLAYLSQTMSKNEFRRFKADLRIQALVTFVEKSGDIPEKKDWRLVNKSLKALGRKIDSLYRKKAISFDYAKQAEALLAPLKKWTAEKRDPVLKPNIPTQIQAFINPNFDKLEIYYQTQDEALVNEAKEGSLKPVRFSANDLCQKIGKISPGTIDSLQTSLTSILVELQASFKSGAYESVYFTALDLILNTPWPPYLFYPDTPYLKQKSEVAASLDQLGQLLFDSMVKASATNIHQPAAVAALNKLLNLEAQITCNEESQSAGFNPGILSRTKVNNLTAFVHDQGQLNEFIKDPNKDLGDSIRENQLSVTRKIDEDHLYAVLRHDSYLKPVFNLKRLEEEIMRLDPSEGKTLLKEIQDAVDHREFGGRYNRQEDKNRYLSLYMSPKLPAPLKAMRDTESRLWLAEHYLFEADPNSSEIELKYLINSHCFMYGYQVSAKSADLKTTKRPLFSSERKFSEKMQWVQKLRENPESFGFNTDLFNQHLNEKRLLQQTTHFENAPDTNPEEVKEIARLFIQPNVSIIETLSFFNKNPAKLQDRDYQNIFHAACFNPMAIHALTPHLAGKVFEFLNKQFNKALIEKTGTEKAVFLLRMHRYFSGFEAYSSYQGALTGEVELKTLLNKNLSQEERTLVYTELAVSLSEKKSLTEQEIETFITAVSWKGKNLLSKYLIDPEVEVSIRKGLYRHSQAIEAFFLKGGINQNALNAIYKKVTGKTVSSDKSWCKTNDQEAQICFSIEGGVVFYPLQGRIEELDENGFLPPDVLALSEFKRLFSNQISATALSNGIYRFQDTFGNLIYLHYSQGHLGIEKMIGGKWHRYVQRHNIRDFQSRKLNDHYTFWAKMDEPYETVLIPLEKNDPEYALQRFDNDSSDEDDYSMPTHTLIRLKDKAILRKNSSLFSHFEDPSYLHEWFDENGEKMVELELPRFGLHFDVDPNHPERLLSRQYPGWWVSNDQEVSKLGSSNTHLVLENAQGEKQFLLPKLKLTPPKKKEVLEPALVYERNLKENENVKFEHYLYKIDGKNAIQSNSLEADLYLANILAANSEYESAAAILLKISGRPGALSPKAIELLDEIINLRVITGDMSGEMVSLLLYAAILRSKIEGNNAKVHPLAAHFYREYLRRYQQITALKLEIDEELRLLKNILADTFDPYFFTRLKELDPTYAHYYPYEKKSAEYREASPLNLLSELRSFDLQKSGQAPFRPNLKEDLALVRAEEKIESHLLEYIELAMSGSAEEKNALLTASYFLQGHESKKTKAIGYLLESVLKHSFQFVLAPKLVSSHNDFSLQLSYKADLDTWWQTTLQKASDLTLEDKNKTFLLKEATPDSFRLDEIANPLPKLDFEFNLNTLAPLLSNQEISDHLVSEKAPRIIKKSHYQALKEFFIKKFNATDEEKNPIAKRVWHRSKADLSAYKKQQKEQRLVLKSEVAKIELAVSKGLLEEKQNLETLESDMLELANSYPKDDVLRSLRFIGGTSKKISLSDILISFGRRQPEFLQKLNPHLTQKQLSALYEKAADFMQLSSLIAQKERCLKSCTLIKNAPLDEQDDLKNQLVDQLCAKRSYKIEEHPEYLVFEHYSQMIIREDQVKMLDALLNGEISNPVMEMIMGSGKSKVLLPLCGLLRANGQELSLLIVPEPLYEDVSSETEKILRDDFAKALKTLYFDRNSSFTFRSLEEIKDTLKAAVANRDCLVMTSKSISSLLLKFIEHRETLYKQNKIEDELTALMQEIIEILTTLSNPLIDEVDTVLSVLHEVSFSLGEKTPPKPYEGALVSELYRLLYTDPDLKSLMRLVSDPMANVDAPPLTKEHYSEKIKAVLAEKVFESLKSIDLKDKKLNADLHLFLKNLTKDDEKLLLAYFTRDENLMGRAQKFYDSLPENIQEIVSLASEEICHFLPHTLIKQANISYGLYRNLFATPFKGADTPCKNALFINPYITMNYTFAFHYEMGISEDVLKKILNQLYNSAQEQIEAENISLKETDAYKKFMRLCDGLDIPLLDYTEEQLALLKESVNQSFEKKSAVIQEHIFPTIEIYDEKISCNPLIFSALLQKLSGFTGTLSKGSLHSKIKAKPEIGTEAKTMALLYAMKDAPVVKVKKGPLKQMIEELKAKNLNIDLLSDGGGYYKEGGATNVARALAQAFNKPTVFYNEQNEKTVTDGVNDEPFANTSLKESERNTFLDQSHTTGSDIDQKQTALEAVTIGKDMTLRDFSQAVWRARKLGKGQKVIYLIDDEVDAIIRQKLKLGNDQTIAFLEIYEFLVLNKCERQGDDNFKAFKKELWSLVQHLAFESLLRKDLSPLNKMAAYTLLRQYWIKEQSTSAAKQFGMPALPRPKEAVLAEEKAKVESVLKELSESLFFIKNSSDEALGKIEALITRYKKQLPPLLISPSSDDSETAEIEQETEADVDTQAQTFVESQVDESRGGVKLKVKKLEWTFTIDRVLKNVEKFIKGEGDKHDLYYKYEKMWIAGEPLPKDFGFRLNLFIKDLQKLDQWMQNSVELKLLAPYFEGIDLCENVFEEDDKNPPKKLFGSYRTPLNYLRVDGDDVAILSLVEEKYSNYHLSIGSTKNEIKLSRTAFEKIVKIKFLSGECSYKKVEMEFLEKWLKEAGPFRMQEFFTKTILKNKLADQEQLPNTPLGKLFRALISQ